MASKTRKQLLEENPDIYLVEIILRNGSSILTWMRTFNIQHNDGRLTGLDWQAADPRDQHPMWIDLREVIAVVEKRTIKYAEYYDALVAVEK